MIRCISIPLFVTSSLWSYAQDIKFEKEKRLTKDQVPPQIIELLDSMTIEATKTRYFYETDGKHESYEVKFWLNKTKYSVEFAKNLELEDVEVLVPYETLTSEVRNKMKKFFNDFDKYKIIKTQKQFSSEELSDLKIESVVKKSKLLSPYYEIVVHTKKDGKWNTYEVLFDSNGNSISKRRLSKRSEDFILY